jgi:Zn-dependent metalloprotease
MGGTAAGAAALAIGLALVALTGLILVLGALGSSALNPAPHSISAAAHDAAVVFYLAQLVGVTFFHHTGELRFAAIPALLLIGLSIAGATALLVRRTPGPARRKLLVALAVPIPYALIVGIAGVLVPLEFTARGFGVGIAVSPLPAEAFLLPLAWGLVFASVGGLIGVFGWNWRRPVSRALGSWSAPLASTLPALFFALAVCVVVALVGALSMSGWDLRVLTGGGFDRILATIGAAVVALPTLAAGVLVSGFGVPFGWRETALSQGHGTVSALGGTLPSVSHGHAAPGILVLAPIIAVSMVIAVGWMAARCADRSAALGLANAARAAALTTVAVWVLGLLARVDAQAGGLLGLHLAPDTGALLWRVPLVAFSGCLIGGFAYALTRGVGSPRELAAGLRAAVHPSNWSPDTAGRPTRARVGIGWRAALGMGFAAIPVLLVGLGPAGAASSPATPTISFAPVVHAAEAKLERHSAHGQPVSATVDPATRKIGTATARIPLTAVGGSGEEGPGAAARTVLASYGNLFGLSNARAELGEASIETDSTGATSVSFRQMADGLPVYESGIGVVLSPNGEAVTWMTGSVIPEVSVAEDELSLTSAQAIAVATKEMPSSTLVEPASLQAYAGVAPTVSGPTARLAWCVRLVDNQTHASNEYVVDAITGKILEVTPRTEYALYREVFNAKEKPELPGVLARKEGEGANANEEVNNAYTNSGETEEFFQQVLERNSYDDAGSHVKSTVEYAEGVGKPFKDAFWNGQEMVFGHGYPKALDIVAHEYGHAVLEYSSELSDERQSGALNESFGDIMGEATEWFAHGYEEPDWVVGAALPGGAIRNLKTPSKFQELLSAGDEHHDPAKISEWDTTCLDNFGVNINSTVTDHAFYLAATSLEKELGAKEKGLGFEEATRFFYKGWTFYLRGNANATLEQARAATLKAVEEYSHPKGSSEYEKVATAFNEVGLNGSAEPAAPVCEPECSAAAAMETAEPATAHGSESAVEMLATLYKARGELAQTSVAGSYFTPLYEDHMERISELVSEDPTLAAMTISGLHEVTPALEGLIEGEGAEYELGSAEMTKIKAALERLAQDDRLYTGEESGELAELIETELKWLELPSYGSMTYASGFRRLNSEVEAHSTLVESGELITPLCLGHPYSNNFEIDSLYVSNEGDDIPGQASPLDAGGTVCGTAIKAGTGHEGCTGKESLNTKMTVQLPAGDKVDSTKELTAGSYVGKATGSVVVCAGENSQIIKQGEANLQSLKTWTTAQCPTAALSCYEGVSTFETGTKAGAVTGRSYAWVTEEAGRLNLTTKPIEVRVETAEGNFNVLVGLGQFGVELCAHAGAAGGETCGGPTAPWLHKNAESAVVEETGCRSGSGRFVAKAENREGKVTQPVQVCVGRDATAHMQQIDTGHALKGVSCIPATTSCVAVDQEGVSMYSTNVSDTATATWHSWAGPSHKPAEAVSCPTSTFCMVAAGEVEGGGGNLYYATSLGGTFSTALLPTHGVDAVSCPAASFCVAAQATSGSITWSSSPAGTKWRAVEIGSGAMKGISCLSAAFCAVVDSSGHVHVATTEAKVKEAAGWKSTDIDGTTPLLGIVCTSTTSCLAVDGTGEVLRLTINASGEATVTRAAVERAVGLTSITCSGSDCAAADNDGQVFGSENGGASWRATHGVGETVEGMSCASASVCAAVTNSGYTVGFNSVPPEE